MKVIVRVQSVRGLITVQYAGFVAQSAGLVVQTTGAMNSPSLTNRGYVPFHIRKPPVRDTLLSLDDGGGDGRHPPVYDDG